MTGQNKQVHHDTETDDDMKSVEVGADLSSLSVLPIACKLLEVSYGSDK
jgi:hypothetical protein